MKRDYSFELRCEKIAVEQRRQLQLQPHDPLPGETLAERYGVVLREPDELPGITGTDAARLSSSADWDGVLLPNLPHHPPLILLRPGVAPVRRQSTIMHEMAHLLLEHQPLALDSASGLFTARRQKDEREAAHLGGCLQIPRVGLVWALQAGLNVARTALHFGASEQMVIYRVNMTRVRLLR